VVLTFDPHPMAIVAPSRLPKLLTTIEQRRALFEQIGFDYTAVLPFTREVACLSAEQFVEQVLAARLHARWVVVGENFRFGHRGSGDIELLRRFGQRHGYRAESIEPVLVGGEPVSSTRVRRLLLEGRVTRVRKLLCRPFALEGPIVPGHGVGARQTVPTLNLQPESELWPARGVYVSSTRELVTGRRWQSITNIGTRPTFNGAEQTVETFLLSALVGDTPTRIELSFHWRLRDEKRFDSPGALRSQILADAARAKRYFRLAAAAGRNRQTV
jgi:riboflavin kinase/FMN adenylyltransferase